MTNQIVMIRLTYGQYEISIQKKTEFILLLCTQPKYYTKEMSLVMYRKIIYESNT